ncbi:murein DD-endopeptidase MepM/ murein hydrolase activator NlpD [Rheinheimera pacifica]|uniref:M23 family metallopeptidase n=1 Tax=Rheinheimera pacifica TaxID=173990 RepID=UPI000CBEAC7A|nr:M23 family metallopeptidase [Rheinheimera pacifica]MDR6982854.1 murein DD-endopeptidase MepM/ murein hydrolase activator NlpD [Rheinheimera pacifica]PKM20118.1 MAG: peptidase [Gammaproteobacteria bacterium HGW-Gammaproteobacteria-15]
MKVWVKALSLLASVSFALFAQPALELEGQLTQGSLLRGKAAVGSKVFFNDIELPLSSDGRFVFGIGRDAPLKHQLTVQLNGEKYIKPLTFTARQYDIQHVNGVAQKYVTPPAEVTERIRRDNQQVRAVRETVSGLPFIFDTPIMPAKGRISGVYGSQRVFNGEPRNPHYGLDVAAPVGAPVVAPLSGKVLLAEDLYYSGLTLIIDHGFGISSTFMHLSRFDVAVGDNIEQGQKIAEVGATGRVTGPHLDWRINWQQERLDPALLPGLKLP